MPSFWTRASSPSAAPQPDLASATLDSLNLDSNSDASDDDKTEGSMPHGIDSDTVFTDENTLVIDGGKKESESESEDPHRTDVKPDDKAHA
jgi:hypothetical protein